MKLTNVNINVAPILDVFGLDELANPISALRDDRVIAMIAHGIEHKNIAPLIKKRCDWTEIIND